MGKKCCYCQVTRDGYAVPCACRGSAVRTPPAHTSLNSKHRYLFQNPHSKRIKFVKIYNSNHQRYHHLNKFEWNKQPQQPQTRFNIKQNTIDNTDNLIRNSWQMNPTKNNVDQKLYNIQ